MEKSFQLLGHVTFAMLMLYSIESPGQNSGKFGSMHELRETIPSHVPGYNRSKSDSDWNLEVETFVNGNRDIVLKEALSNTNLPKKIGGPLVDVISSDNPAQEVIIQLLQAPLQSSFVMFFTLSELAEDADDPGAFLRRQLEENMTTWEQLEACQKRRLQEMDVILEQAAERFQKQQAGQRPHSVIHRPLKEFRDDRGRKDRPSKEPTDRPSKEPTERPRKERMELY